MRKYVNNHSFPDFNVKERRDLLYYERKQNTPDFMIPSF